MQSRPDASTLLDAVAAFLMAEVAPKLEADKALQFRVMIAANVTTVVAAELRTEDDRFAAEAERLKALVPEAAGLPSTALGMNGVRRCAVPVHPESSRGRPRRSDGSSRAARI